MSEYPENETKAKGGQGGSGRGNFKSDAYDRRGYDGML
jgi:hypothetical protein